MLRDYRYGERNGHKGECSPELHGLYFTLDRLGLFFEKRIVGMSSPV